MNASNAKDYLPLVQALAEGRTIQGYFEIDEVWRDIAELRFDASASQYRIKPESREIWSNRYPDGSESATKFTSERAAMLATNDPKVIQVCYREVIE